jgi:hypothetical protein
LPDFGAKLFSSTDGRTERMQNFRDFLYPQSFAAEPTSTLVARRQASQRARWNIGSVNFASHSAKSGFFTRLNALLNP